MTPRPNCSYRVFTGARHDWTGHLCELKPTQQTPDGKWWCTRHFPDNAKAKADAKAEAAKAERARVEALNAELQAMADELEKFGVRSSPTKSYFAKHGDPYSYVSVSRTELQKLLELLRGKVSS